MFFNLMFTPKISHQGHIFEGNLSRETSRGHLHGLLGSTLDQRLLLPEFESQPGHI